jgi:two-component system, OmpR family, response regulator VicR
VAEANKRILVVDDDPTISDLVAFNLKRNGYDVIQEYNGRAGLRTALSQSVDLVLMDLMLPGLDGMSASRGILREKPHTPVIILTALLDRENLLEGFQAGAVDYVTKPFDIEVLLARVAASLRRSAETRGWVPSEVATPELGDLMVDSDARLLKNGPRAVPLTPNEHALLRLLLSQPGHLFDREEITEHVWHHRYLPSSRTLDVHMRRLRQKLRTVQADVSIHVVRGVGYHLAR